MTEWVQIAVGLLTISTIVGGIVMGVARWLHQHIRQDITEAIDTRIQPLDNQIQGQSGVLEKIRYEVTYDHGTSLKDGVRAIARHLGIDIQEGPFITVIEPDAPSRKTSDF